jgi:hypothetical protein
VIVAALGLSIERGANGTVVLTQAGEEVVLSRESWDRIVRATALNDKEGPS